MTSTQNARTNRIISVAVATMLLGAMAGAGSAVAVPVVGAEDNATATVRTAGTNNLRITLSQGNAEDDGSAPTGKVAGVTISLQRLDGINPASSADMKKIEETSLDEIIAQWPKHEPISGVTDANGTVYFAGLESGVYLVTSSAPDESYREINSFLVAVPFHAASAEGEAPEGVIVAKPKPPTPPPTTTPPTTPPTSPPTTPPTSPPTKPTTSPTSPSPSPGTSPSTSPSRQTPTPAPSTSTKPGTPATPSKPGSSGGLALTGSQVLGLVTAASILIGAGLVTLIAAQRKNRKG